MFRRISICSLPRSIRPRLQHSSIALGPAHRYSSPSFPSHSSVLPQSTLRKMSVCRYPLHGQIQTFPVIRAHATLVVGKATHGSLHLSPEVLGFESNAFCLSIPLRNIQELNPRAPSITLSFVALADGTVQHASFNFPDSVFQQFQCQLEEAVRLQKRMGPARSWDEVERREPTRDMARSMPSMNGSQQMAKSFTIKGGIIKSPTYVPPKSSALDSMSKTTYVPPKTNIPAAMAATTIFGGRGRWRDNGRADENLVTTSTSTSTSISKGSRAVTNTFDLDPLNTGETVFPTTQP